MTPSPNRIRISFDIDRAVNDRLREYLPWGSLSSVMRALILRLIMDITAHGPGVVSNLLMESARIEKTMRIQYDELEDPPNQSD